MKRINLPLLLLVVSVGITVGLAYRVKQLETVVLTLKAQGRLSEGQLLPTLDLQDLKGQAVSISYSPARRRPLLIYVFTPTCIWCERNFSNMTALTSAVADRYEVIGVAITEKGVAEYAEAKKINYPVFVATDVSKERYKLGGTPTTLVIAPDGTLKKVWRGAYQDEQLDDVEAFFSLSLPGVSGVPQSSTAAK